MHCEEVDAETGKLLLNSLRASMSREAREDQFVDIRTGPRPKP